MQVLDSASPSLASMRASGILSAVSDGYIRLIPTDLNWQPTPEAAAEAVAYVARLFSGPDDDVEHVDHEFYDQVTLVDAGENTTRITCSRCAGEIDMEWFYDLIEESGESFDNLDATVPCCGALVSLDTLHYDWPVGFARFEVCAMNPTRAKYELDAQELVDVATLLGHPVTQILAHY
ncbi:hypothetical protein ACFOW4_27960 [Micromonospora sp. GCM10011542]|uniref:hypothetical protein n=1 Tax=Micromonospora sp. GCM10011542 TaxID=3317337 RepID=UPI003610BAEC